MSETTAQTMSDVEIGNAIIAGIADGETILEKMAEVIDHLRLAGFVIVPIGGGVAQGTPERIAELQYEAGMYKSLYENAQRVPDTGAVRNVIGAFYKTLDVMKSARNKPDHLMCIWADDMKAAEDVVSFLEGIRDNASAVTSTVHQGTEKTGGGAS